MPSGSVAVAAIARLRRLAPTLADGDADQQWLGQAISRYLQEARSGVNLDVTIGVAVGPGGTSWWQAERDAERDVLMRAVVAATEGPAHTRALALRQKLRRYAGTSWLRDRVSKQPTAANAVLFQIFSIDPDPPTGITRLKEILSG